MKKTLLALMVIVAVFLSACCVFNTSRHPEPKMSLPDRLQRDTVAMVRYVAPDEEGHYSPSEPDAKGASLVTYCAGVWITNDVFVTAHHCVEDIGKPFEQGLLEKLVPREEWDSVGIVPWNPVGQSMRYSVFEEVRETETRSYSACHRGTVLEVDEEHDLALVKASPDSTDPIPSHGTATLAHEARVGQDVHIVGHTIGLWWSYTRGWVSQIRPNMPGLNENPVNSLQVSAPIFYGNSGGGAFNEEGELLGIMSYMRKAPSIGFFVRYDEVDRLLKHSRITR